VVGSPGGCLDPLIGGKNSTTICRYARKGHIERAVGLSLRIISQKFLMPPKAVVNPGDILRIIGLKPWVIQEIFQESW